jgi:hypothetical protein
MKLLCDSARVRVRCDDPSRIHQPNGQVVEPDWSGAAWLLRTGSDRFDGGKTSRWLISMPATFSKSSHTIASFSVGFTPRTRVECVLYLARLGSVERVCSHLMRKNTEPVPFRDHVGRPWQLTVTVWLSEEPSGQGWTKYSLQSTGCWGSADWHSGRNHESFPILESCVLFGGDLTKGIPEKDAILFYVGGDRRPFNAGSTRDLLEALSRFHRQERTKRMTPMQFAEQNRGNFVILTLRWFNVDAD